MKLAMFEGAALPRMLQRDLWHAGCEDEGLYSLSLRGMRAVIEEWTRLGVTADVHEHAVLWACRCLPADYRVAKKATISYWAEAVHYEWRRRSESGYFVLYHNVEYEFWITAARYGRYVPITNLWKEWKVAPGCWAELPPTLAYVGSTVISNAESAWWVVHCTGWVISVGMYIVWDSYDTGRLWWIPPKVRSALWRLSETALTNLLGTDGFGDLQRFVDIIDPACRDDVPIRRSDRDSSSKRDRSPTVDRIGGDYLWIDPVPGEVVDPWSAKRRRGGMYPGDTPFPNASAYRAQTERVPRTFQYVQSGLSSAMPYSGAE